MRISIFTVPVGDSSDLVNELNRFLASNKILEVDQHFYQNSKGGYWTFCVRYLEKMNEPGRTPFGKNKTDYKNVLTERNFKKFSRLREFRKAIANDDAVPAYAVFTDAELAEIAKLDVFNEKMLLAIPGIGKKKVEKYGEILLRKIQNEELFNYETDREPGTESG